MSLFEQNNTNPPLAERVRPKTLSGFIGQEHLTGEGKILRQLIEKEKIPSLILWGPPGSGKTTLARIIANQTKNNFIEFSAVTVGIPEVKKFIAEARSRLELYGTQTIIFIDEIHRFNKAQQDALLPHVEKGTITLIGATTENPSFEVISPLLSRTRVLVLNQLDEDSIKILIKNALKIDVTLTNKSKNINEDVISFLAGAANGDARRALNCLEIAYDLSDNNIITLENIKEALQEFSLRYDKTGEEHYNTISAFIKSLRGSSPDAALYYLARMLKSGEDPLFIARRMVIFASEDIGNAKPEALSLAVSVFLACERVGLPECELNLAQGATYLATAPKSRSSCNALLSAKEEVENSGNLPIPMHLRNAPTKLMRELGYGKGKELEQYLPDKIKNKRFNKSNES